MVQNQYETFTHVVLTDTEMGPNECSINYLKNMKKMIMEFLDKKNPKTDDSVFEQAAINYLYRVARQHCPVFIWKFDPLKGVDFEIRDQFRKIQKKT